MGRIRTKVSNFFSKFNLLAVWREERRLDREANILIAHDLADAIRLNSEVATKAIALADKFLISFQISDEPDRRVVREEDEVAEAMKRFEMSSDDFEEVNPFSVTY